MEEYLKFKEARLSYLNNAEYINFLRRFMAMLPLDSAEEERPGGLSLMRGAAKGASKLGISAGQVTQMEGYIDHLTDLNNQSRTSQETAPRAELDRQRDRVASFILSRINGSSSLPLQAEREAGVFLRNVVKPYTGMTRLPYNQETETIRGLLKDLRKEENTEAAGTLGLTAYMTELERLNDEFEDLTAQRLSTQTEQALANSKTVRAEADLLYGNMTDLAFAWSLAEPSEEATKFITDVNALIDETRVANNQRKKGPGEGTAGEGGGSGSGGEERPGGL